MSRITDSQFAGFNGLGISPTLLKAIERMKFTDPTPVQRQSIPVAVNGQDLIAIAQTGTGKTLAFGVPMIQRLGADKKSTGLIVVPTRELAIQVNASLSVITRAGKLRTAVLIGGESMNAQCAALRKTPRIIIATPGRLIDHLDRNTVNLDEARIVVLDEADRMLDMGFAPQIDRIFKHLPSERQTMLFSATMPDKIVAIARSQMKLPVHVEIARSGTTAEEIAQEIFFVDKRSKTQLLGHLLGQYDGPVLVFTRTKYAARNIARKVRNMGHASTDISSDRTQAQRRKALDGFRAGKYRVLVATDIAARGLDITGIELVVNYDLPTNSEDYVHRIGRTGRAGRIGKAISFASFDQRDLVRNIERLIRIQLPVGSLPDLAELPALPPSNDRSTQPPKRLSHRSATKPAPNKPARPRPSARKHPKSAKKRHKSRPPR